MVYVEVILTKIMAGLLTNSQLEGNTGEMRLTDEEVNAHLKEQLEYSEDRAPSKSDNEVDQVVRKSKTTISIIAGGVLLIVLILALWFLRDILWPNRWVP